MEVLGILFDGLCGIGLVRVLEVCGFGNGTAGVLERKCKIGLLSFLGRGLRVDYNILHFSVM